MLQTRDACDGICIVVTLGDRKRNDIFGATICEVDNLIRSNRSKVARLMNGL